MKGEDDMKEQRENGLLPSMEEQKKMGQEVHLFLLYTLYIHLHNSIRPLRDIGDVCLKTYSTLGGLLLTLINYVTRRPPRVINNVGVIVSLYFGYTVVWPTRESSRRKIADWV